MSTGKRLVSIGCLLNLVPLFLLQHAVWGKILSSTVFLLSIVFFFITLLGTDNEAVSRGTCPDEAHPQQCSDRPRGCFPVTLELSTAIQTVLLFVQLDRAIADDYSSDSAPLMCAAVTCSNPGRLRSIFVFFCNGIASSSVLMRQTLSHCREKQVSSRGREQIRYNVNVSVIS